MDEHSGSAAKLFQQVDELIATMRNETTSNFNEMAKRVELMVEGARAQMGKEGAPGGGDRERASGGGGRGIDKKEVSVWKPPEELDRMAFRHWSDAIDVNLELVHGFRHAGFVMNQIRRSKVEITKPVFETCVAQANVDVEQFYKGLGMEGEHKPGEALLSVARDGEHASTGHMPISWENSIPTCTTARSA